MHDASGKTIPHPEGAECLCPEAHRVLLVRGKNTPVFHCSFFAHLHSTCLHLHLPFLCRSLKPISPGAQSCLLPLCKLIVENRDSQEPSDTVLMTREIF